MKNISAGVICAALGLAFPGLASAAVISNSLEVRATVVAACDNVSTTPVDFGTYNGGTINAEGSVSVNCLEGTRYLIGLGMGNQPLGNVRRMVSTTATGVIRYALFTDAARSNPWGPCTDLICVLPRARSEFGTGTVQTFTVFGQALPPDLFNPAPQPGDFKDVVTVDVHF